MAVDARRCGNGLSKTERTIIDVADFGDEFDREPKGLRSNSCRYSVMPDSIPFAGDDKPQFLKITSFLYRKIQFLIR
jgi:hypothetical protein